MDVKSFGQIFAYNKDKNETYVVEVDEFRAVDEDVKYKFFKEEGKY